MQQTPAPIPATSRDPNTGHWWFSLDGILMGERPTKQEAQAAADNLARLCLQVAPATVPPTTPASVEDLISQAACLANATNATYETTSPSRRYQRQLLEAALKALRFAIKTLQTAARSGGAGGRAA